MSGDDFEELARLVGVAAGYRDAFGQQVAVAPEHRRAVLACLGFPCGTGAEISGTIARARDLLGAVLPRTLVVEARQPRKLAIPPATAWSLAEEGGRLHEERVAEGLIELPALPPGYHRLEARGPRFCAEATVIAAPPRCWEPDWLREGGRAWGLAAQVYSLRSARDLGIGGYGEVKAAAGQAARFGASFLGLSPIHALFAADRTKVSPYSPSSRLFLEPLYIDPTALPGFAGSEAARRLGEDGRSARIAALRAEPLVDHAGTWAELAPVLEAYFAECRSTLMPGLDRFRREAGPALEHHARFEALWEHFQRSGRSWPGEWPEAFRDRESAEVASFAQADAERVAFYAWLQQAADDQLREAQEAALAAGMPIGLYRDLAVGPDRGGSEVWSAPDLFGRTLSVGAPPDLLAPQGQDWGLPPLHPLMLQATGLAAFRDLVRTNLRHAGAIRIDHAFQLQRLYVIPEGGGGGAYVAYPFEAMLAVLRIESHRARALVVAEDLGTAPEGFSDAIMASGLLSYRVLFFEREAEGVFKPPSAYPREAMAAITTHDLPTLVGWWRGLDTDLREALGIYDAARAEKERAERMCERGRLCDALAAEGLMPVGAPPPSIPAGPVLRFLACTPSALSVVQYEDVLGAPDQPNVPGTVEGHPNWRRKLGVEIEAIGAPGGPLAAVASAMAAEGRDLRALALSASRWSVRGIAKGGLGGEVDHPSEVVQPGRAGADREPDGEGRVVIEAVWPELDGGRTPIKRLVGDVVEVWADIFSDGHDRIAADILYRPADEEAWRRAPMHPVDNDRWRGSFPLERNARYLFTIEGWRDPFASWLHEIEAKREAGIDVRLETIEGARIAEQAAQEAEGSDGEALRELVVQLERAGPGSAEQLGLILDPANEALIARNAERRNASRYRELAVVADRLAARFSAWYELFPRSMSHDAERHGTFDDVIAMLPYVRDLGFDVLYFPPIHPVGRTNRKGRNNALTAVPGDVGSVYAIGDETGGHDAVHPDLGGIEAFRRLVAAARDHGLEIALDFAIQCSPDHPWIRQHPDWFEYRPDGTMKYAENPPKKYEDIYNVSFYGAAKPGLWQALRDVVLFWCREGVRIFRVDNPHTKPLPFWDWLIAEVGAQYPDAIFLAEAFTRPKMMRKLAKIGFQQSYTYFTWRDTKHGLTEYMNELAHSEMGEYYRPNFFTNTPDINPIYLQTSGRPGFVVRATLAATLSSAWGIYNGFELCEAALFRREEYLDSEKYEIRVWDYDRPGNIREHIARLNRIRQENPALRDFRNIQFLNAWNDQIVSYLRMTPAKDNALLILVNLDPHNRQECSYEVPLWEFGLPDDGALLVEDLLGFGRFELRGKTHRIALDPAERSCVIWRLTPPGRA